MTAGLVHANPPGVDTIELGHYSLPALQGGAASSSGPAVSGGGDTTVANAGNSAKLARFSAKIMTLDSDQTGNGFSTNAQVRTASDSANNLCILDIGSVTASGTGFNAYGPAGESAQPVLIRGNVVNVCK